MEPLIIVTGNINKFEVAKRELGIPVVQKVLDIDEIQSLDLREVLEAKARLAYKKLGEPVVVDDISLIFHDLHGLPGPLIRWFEESLGLEKLCRLADLGETRGATVEVGIGYCDDSGFEAFISTRDGKVAQEPRGSGGFGWDSIFIPEGETETRAEMSEKRYRETSIREKSFRTLETYLKTK
ncbi:hypothetical protein COB52_01810 [Candidatus Kaiserbacteria bacterium]|nr:MAG: hypothetical protein COB52_01810 [Candidatus Kaiserbacteria bacterium]